MYYKKIPSLLIILWIDFNDKFMDYDLVALLSAKAYKAQIDNMTKLSHSKLSTRFIIHFSEKFPITQPNNQKIFADYYTMNYVANFQAHFIIKQLHRST